LSWLAFPDRIAKSVEDPEMDLLSMEMDDWLTIERRGYLFMQPTASRSRLNSAPLERRDKDRLGVLGTDYGVREVIRTDTVQWQSLVVDEENNIS
jgi:hypothetical protein